MVCEWQDYIEVPVIFKSSTLVFFNLSAANHWRAAAKILKNPQILVYIYIFLDPQIKRYYDYHYHSGGLENWLTLKRSTLLTKFLNK